VRFALAVLLVVGCHRDDPPPKPQIQLVPGPPPSQQTKVKPPRPPELTHVTIKALGMYCEEECPMKVRYALADIPAVYELGFDVTTESIFVSYDKKLGPSREVTKPMIVAIRGVGFDPWLARESWPDKVDAQVVER
jgi:hypothetical protein